MRKRAVVPAQLNIEGVHGVRLEGHFSSDRSFLFLVLGREDVHAHAKHYPQCTVVTGTSRSGRQPLQPIPVSNPFQIVGVDIFDQDGAWEQRRSRFSGCPY